MIIIKKQQNENRFQGIISSDQLLKYIRNLCL